MTKNRDVEDVAISMSEAATNDKVLRELNFGTPVTIKWVDSTSNARGWIHNEEVEPKVVTIMSIGFVVAGDDEALAITHSMHEEGDVYDTFSIPWGCIETLEEVNLAVEEQNKREQPRVQDSEDGRGCGDESKASLVI